MTKLRILDCALDTANRSPRSCAMINHLSDDYDVSFSGFECTIEGISFYKIEERRGLFIRLLILFLKLLRCHYNSELIRYKLDEKIRTFNFDLIICHDLELLPYVFQANKDATVLFDAREYYPRHFENSLLWRFVQSPFQEHLCRKYLKYINRGITVSAGLKRGYLDNFGINMEVFYSLPPAFDLQPSAINNELRLIHHGGSNPERKIEQLIYAMDFVRKGIFLDIMLTGTGRYYNFLQKLCSTRKNVKLIPPVEYKQIIPVLNRYDMGIIFYPASSFNLKHCMPNKLFEFVQARLGILTAPLFDIKNFVESNNLGNVCKSFSPESLATSINNLSYENVKAYKIQANNIAVFYNQKESRAKVKELVRSILSQ